MLREFERQIQFGFHCEEPQGGCHEIQFDRSVVPRSVTLLAPIHSFAAEPYCIAVNGGFGGGGTTFVARSFSLPAESKCTPWSGYTKTASTVILTTTGTSCLSSDSKALTVSVISADPWFLGADQIAADYIQLPRGNTTEPFSGTDFGYFTGSAEPVTCSSELLSLSSSHD